MTPDSQSAESLKCGQRDRMIKQNSVKAFIKVLISTEDKQP